MRAQNGAETVVSYNAATFHNRDRKLLGVFAAARDVTERKRFERTLEEKNIELVHASRMKSEFLATMSHELRTPLNAIIGFSEALKDGLMGQLSVTQHEYIADIFSSGQHLLSLINDILDLSKVEAGMMTLDLGVRGLERPAVEQPVDREGKSRSSEYSIGTGSRGSWRVPVGRAQDQADRLQLVIERRQIQRLWRTRNTARAARRTRAVGTLPGSRSVYGFALADSEYQEFIEICVADSGIGISR